MATLNKQSFYLKFKARYAKQLKRSIDSSVEKQFKDAKSNLLQEIKNDPISIEIAGGPTADPSSGVVSRGNLFSFIGFQKERQPITELLELIEENVKLYPAIITNRTNSIFFYSRRIGYPRITDIEGHSATDYDWDGPGGSWVHGVRTGVSGFLNYVYRTIGELKKSRSGTGLQSKKANLGGDHTAQEGYIVDQLAEFEDAIDSINIENIDFDLR